jgi:hypothetical protein
MKIKIPESLKLEHKEIHSQLAEATKFSGRLGVLPSGGISKQRRY